MAPGAVGPVAIDTHRGIGIPPPGQHAVRAGSERFSYLRMADAAIHPVGHRSAGPLQPRIGIDMALGAGLIMVD